MRLGTPFPEALYPTYDGTGRRAVQSGGKREKAGHGGTQRIGRVFFCGNTASVWYTSVHYCVSYSLMAGPATEPATVGARAADDSHRGSPREY